MPVAAFFLHVLCSSLAPLPAAASSDVLSKRIVDYVIAIEGYRALKADPKCGYVVRKDEFPRPPYRELTTRLPEEKRRSFERYIGSREWAAMLEEMTASVRQQVAQIAGRQDDRTTCGIWAGFAITKVTSAREDFVAATTP